MTENTPRLLIFIPTYNESENVRPLYEKLRKLPLEADILWLDDNSPDGTGGILDEMASADGKMRVIHRAGKEGIGSAHMEGINYAYEKSYDVLITMDCDFTHDPADVPEFLSASEGVDIAVGSRYLRDNSLEGWSAYRKILTNLGHFLTRHLLGMPYDATGAFRLYVLKGIDREIFRKVRSRGYSFFFESLFALMTNGLRIKELPIALPPRTYGHSKMSLRDIMQSVVRLFKLYFKFTLNKKLYLIEPGSPASIDSWDKYWEQKKTKTSALYDKVASFYRDYIIKRTLNHYIRRHFPPEAVLLHAGCGGGQVDRDIAVEVKVIPLDLSVSALKLYRANVDSRRMSLIQGDIFRLPIADSSLDGVYNLGVMEHFKEEEIRAILGEFRRVVREGGRIVLFWPPEFGLSVIFLKGVHFFLNRVMGLGIKLHPDEITRLKSKRHIKDIIEGSGLEIMETYFGIKDLFTYCIVVLRKPGHAAPVLKSDVISRLACPSCHGELTGNGASALVCSACKREYAGAEGIYIFAPPA